MAPSKHPSSQRGQVVIEFVVTLLVAVTIVGAFAVGLRTTFGKLWKQLACEISAPCPGCKAPEKIRKNNAVSTQDCKDLKP